MSNGNNDNQTNGNAKRKDVFVIREGKNGDSFWTKVGVAFVNKDSSLNVILEAVPVDGKLNDKPSAPSQIRWSGRSSPNCGS